MKRLSMVLGCLAVLGFLVSAALVFAGGTNVNGKWDMKVVTAKDTGSATFTFQQSGEQLTGKYTGSLGEWPVTGTIKGNDVVFQFTRDPQKGPIVYSGKVDDKKMSGNIDFAGVAKGSFDGIKID